MIKTLDYFKLHFLNYNLYLSIWIIIVLIIIIICILYRDFSKCLQDQEFRKLSHFERSTHEIIKRLALRDIYDGTAR